MAITNNYYGSYRFTVCDKFIKAHEIATGYPMALHQKTVLCTFVDMLYGIGTVNGTNLMDRFIADGTVLFPLCPTNDNDAYMAGFEIDLISGEKMGEYVNMDSTNISVKGAIATLSGQRFECFKGTINYKFSPGYTFAYSQDVCPISAVSVFGNDNTTGLGSEVLFPRHSAGNGWAYVFWNGYGDACIFGKRYNGQMGAWMKNSTIPADASLYYTSGDGQYAVVYPPIGGTPQPTSLNSSRMVFHSSGANTHYFTERLSMYGFGIQFTENEDTAFNDLSQAIRYYQENILSNDTRRWV